MHSKKHKESILQEFQLEKSGLRVLIATIPFGMGIDCKGVCRVIHFGPSKNFESYVQETGRAGRDGKQSVDFIIYQGRLLNHVDRDMKKCLMQLLYKKDNLAKFWQLWC